MSTKKKPQSASEWMVALNEAPGDGTLRLEHRRWLANSDSNRRDWAETREVWRLMAMTLPAHGDDWSRPVVASPASVRTAVKRPARPANGSAPGQGRLRRLLRRPFLAASGIAAVAALLLALLPDVFLSLRADHSSATGEVKLIDLEDGSRLLLAPESAVALAFDTSARRVELLRGEAFFDVVAENERPFQVRAGAVDTVVLGTRFAVGLEPDSTQVAVEEGSVRVDYAPARDSTALSGSRLSSGDLLKIAPDGGITKEEISPSLVAAWRNGLLVAQHRPLGELVDVLDRYFDGVIVVADAKLASTPLTGIYNLSDPKAALEAMAETQGAQVRALSPWILVLSSR